MGYAYFGDKRKYRPKPLTRREKLNRFLKLCSWSVYHYSGLHYIAHKIKPRENDKEQTPPSFLLWVIVVYAVLFGISSYRFESRYSQLENKLGDLETRLTAAAYADEPMFKKQIEKLPSIQNSLCPREPKLLNPLSIVMSLFLEEMNEKLLVRSMNVFAAWKDRLNGITLIKPVFRDFEFIGINFEGTLFEMPEFSNVNLENASFKNAEIYMAVFENINLDMADFNNTLIAYSTLKGGKAPSKATKNINLDGALLFFVDLREFSLDYEGIIKVATLYGSVLNVTLCDKVVSGHKMLLDAPGSNTGPGGLKAVDKYAKTFQYKTENPLAGYLTKISGKSCTY